ncbi:hypothetical protein TrLO_g1929 [Triparma laevis f. longispina]|uniref:Tyrosine-protein kinase ephrin type A/B receptor-like domain-containing protein n=1 Tax=Triparma laevis f. longispina TaxID=1714387 RepID=A0A9W7ED99_9STRA|nr:hypothetical protein TrLO_g1929 [Triparma laevis f. longispina]
MRSDGIPPRLRAPPLIPRLFLLVIATLLVVADSGVTLSGSSQGTCYVKDNCFGTGSPDGLYNINEACTFTFSDAAAFAVGRFDIDNIAGYPCLHDFLTVDSTKYCGTSGPADGLFTAGQQISFTSSEYVNYARPGFEICIGDPCVSSSSPSDDGSTGAFYCVNGGSVGGFTGYCTCTCKAGTEGPNCATVSASCPPEDRGYTGTPPECVAGPVTLSGSSQGTCYVRDNCFGNGSPDGLYNINEACTFTFSDAAGFTVSRFDVFNNVWEVGCNYGYLMVDSTEYCGTSGPADGLVTAGQQVTFTSVYVDGNSGFEICTGDPCVASSSSSDDGSTGAFYCVNGGSVGGVSGYCTCTSCNTGFGGLNCELPPCAASSSPSDDGSTGAFYCVNGGSVGGYTGSCTCTSCNTGFGGLNCELPPCVASTSPSDDGSTGAFYCVNGGSVGGIAGSCTCTSCSPEWYEGPNCATLSASCPVRFTGTPPDCTTCASGYFGADCQNRGVDNHSDLYNAISNGCCYDGFTAGNNIVSDGSVVRVAQGEYSGWPYAWSGSIYRLDGIYFDLVCAAEPHTCVLDGSNQRQIMYMFGTGSGTLTISCFKFLDGNSGGNGGAGLSVSGGIIVLEFCDFSSCSGSFGGAIYVKDTSTQLDLYVVSFEGNTGTTMADGIYIFSATSVTVHDSCPEGWSGAPTEGSNLDTARCTMSWCDGSDNLFGTPNSFTQGTCQFCSPRSGIPPDSIYFSTSSCQICEAGKFSQGTGGYYCIECASGKIAPAGAEECTSCETGKSSSADFSSCEDCEAGKFGNGGPCTDCPQGTYSTPSSPSCTTCEVGKYNGNERQGSCLLCGQGKYLDSTGAVAETQCKVCPVAKYNDNNGLGTDCFFCQKGKFAPATGYDVCEDCVTGTYASNEGSTRCTQCEEGTHSNVTGSENCADCAGGTFTDYRGAVICQPCPQYTTFSSIEQTCVCLPSFVNDADESCTCKTGETLVNNECVSCEDGRFKDHTGTFSCTVCDVAVIKGAFETITGAEKTSSASCACGVGKFSEAPDEGNPDKTHEAICKDCSEIDLPEGVNCSSVGLTLETLPVNDGYWRSSTDNHNIVACENPASCKHSNSDNNELCAEGHTGPICSVCKEGFSENSVWFCESCASAGLSIGFYFLCGVLGIITLYLVLRKVFGKEKLTISNVTQEFTKATSNDKHWTKRLRTKFKILTSFYQIVTKLPTTLAVKFPKVYETFTAGISSVFNFNAIGLISVGCIIPQSLYGFYGSFLVTTITPIVLSLLLYITTKIQLLKLDPYAANKLTSNRFGLFYGLTYLVFASTSTMAFTTFLCTTYGDDEKEYLIADRSVDCNSDFHKKFELVSWVTILIYPIGITALYSYELWKFKDAIKDPDKRDDDPKIKHIVFLWRDYRPEFWWFEIYECFRRLSFTGMLVFFDPGSAPQICFAMILAVVSLLMYSNNQPFVKSEENTLAQVSTFSIFLTLLAAIMITLKDKLVEENSNELGILLVMVNTLIVAMVGVGFLYKPISKGVKKMNEEHIHNRDLKGMAPEVEYSAELFIDYFQRLAESDEEEAGWTELRVKDWGGNKKKATEWLQETGAKADWRCATGDGPIDQVRVIFTVDTDLSTVVEEIKSIKNRHTKSAGSFIGMAASYLKGVVAMHRKFADEGGHEGGGEGGEERDKAKNPMFAGLTGVGGGGDEDRKNIEMGRMIKRVAGETEEHKNVVVL